MKRVPICHKCKGLEAKVSIDNTGDNPLYLVKCKCGNHGINVQKNPISAIASWGSGHQQCDHDLKSGNR